MILVGQFDSFPTRRIGITLAHYGLAYARATRSIFADTKEIARINPLIRIPALILDDGEVLIVSTAILDTLDEMAGARALVPRAGAGGACCRRRRWRRAWARRRARWCWSATTTRPKRSRATGRTAACG